MLAPQPQSRQSSGTAHAGDAVSLIKRGGPAGAWCKVRVRVATGWLLCEALSSATPAAESHQPARHGSHALNCDATCPRAPLFPTPPVLSLVDQEVLALCPARPDVSVSEGDVRRFMAAHVDDRRIQAALSVAGRSRSRAANIDWLTSLWVGKGPRNAFTHVFCGDDWTTGSVGGLHFLPRYAQLEAEGKLCYQGPVHGEAAAERGQYLIRFRAMPPWSCAVKRTGGFTEEHDPITLVAAATRAFAKCCPRGQSSPGGVFRAPDLSPAHFQIWCGSRNGSFGIASFYPTDAAITCGD